MPNGGPGAYIVYPVCTTASFLNLSFLTVEQLMLPFDPSANLPYKG